MFIIELITKIPWPAIAIGAGIIIVMATSFYFNTKNTILRVAKKLKNKPISRVREGAYVKIIGNVRHVKDPLIAPLSGRKCVYYQIIVEQKGNKNWHTIINDSSFQEFFIEAAGEMALINCHEFEKMTKVFLVKDHNESSGTFKDASFKLEQYLELHGKSSTGILGFNRQTRYKEGILALDEEIAVVGSAHWKSLAETVKGYRYSKILTLMGRPKKKLLITDHPKALNHKS